MTLADIVERGRAAGRCLPCLPHQVEPDSAEIAARFGIKMTALDWHHRLVCSQCGGRQIDMVVTGDERGHAVPRDNSSHSAGAGFSFQTLHHADAAADHMRGFHDAGSEREEIADALLFGRPAAVDRGACPGFGHGRGQP